MPRFRTERLVDQCAHRNIVDIIFLDSILAFGTRER